MFGLLKYASKEMNVGMKDEAFPSPMYNFFLLFLDSGINACVQQKSPQTQKQVSHLTAAYVRMYLTLKPRMQNLKEAEDNVKHWGFPETI